MTITITGNRAEGKSTTAKLLAFLLKAAGYNVTVKEPNKRMQRLTDLRGLDVTALKPRDVTIVST